MQMRVVSERLPLVYTHLIDDHLLIPPPAQHTSLSMAMAVVMTKVAAHGFDVADRRSYRVLV